MLWRSGFSFAEVGEAGTGKTSAALLLAEALGVQIDQAEFGGLHQIASGEQTGETVRRRMESLRCRPFFGSSWKVLVVNEADAMTPNAAFVWLDALEDLPPQTVIIFTTNAAGRIPAGCATAVSGWRSSPAPCCCVPTCKN
ncbi:MAG: AAA family ATPase [Gemmataceae bacterium]